MDHTIKIDQELYEYLRTHADLEESGCSVLKRMLGLRPKGDDPNSKRSPDSLSRSGPRLDARDQALVNFLKGPAFKCQRSVVTKFLAVLGFLYAENPESFSAVEQLRGRTRKYFSTNPSELREFGKSVFPKQVPNSSYWVVTNSDSEAKRGLLLDVMKVLNYGLGGVVAALLFGKEVGIDSPAVSPRSSEDELYERAKKHALAMLDRGFHLGGEFKVSRDELHER